VSEKVDIKKTLRVFNTIFTEGTRSGNEYILNGLRASTDFDGYTVTVCNDYVSLSIFFHNKIAFTFTNNKERTLFLEKIDAMDKKKKS